MTKTILSLRASSSKPIFTVKAILPEKTMSSVAEGPIIAGSRSRLRRNPQEIPIFLVKTMPSSKISHQDQLKYEHLKSTVFLEHVTLWEGQKHGVFGVFSGHFQPAWEPSGRFSATWRINVQSFPWRRTCGEQREMRPRRRCRMVGS